MIMNSKNVAAELRRDMAFVWNAIIAVVLVSFVGFALAAALVDLMAMRH